jgi:hypothetical protein
MEFYEDRMAIVGVLEYARRVLEGLMARLEPGDRDRFQDAWSYETRPQLDEVIGMFRGEPRSEDIQVRAYEKYIARGREQGSDLEDWERAEAELREELASEDGPFRRLMRRVGLAGKSLKMKLHYLADAASGGWRTKLLQLLNKFLGSLASAVPGAEAVKEFKEWLEGFLDNYPEPDSTIKVAYSEAGYDPFCVQRL